MVLANVHNSYPDGTLVEGAATLSLASDAALGNPSGGITLRAGELLSTSSGFNSARSIVLNLSEGEFDVVAAATGTVGTYSGIVSGAGFLVVGDNEHYGYGGLKRSQ